MIFFDIETIARPVDQELLAEAENKIREEYVRENTIKEKIETWINKWKFEPLGAGIVAIAAVNDANEESFSMAGADERAILYDFRDYIRLQLAAGATTLCGFNCLRFDIPVMTRALCEHDIDIGYKFGVRDLMQTKMGRAIGPKSLNWWLKVCGIPKKTGHGSEVQGMVDAGDWDRIREYCLSDTHKTKELYHRMNKLIECY